MSKILSKANQISLPISLPGESDRRLPISITILGDLASLQEVRDLILSKYPDAKVSPDVIGDATNPLRRKQLISIPQKSKLSIPDFW
jgi:hypothetical protein